MTEKETYETPEMEIVIFENEDIITGSPGSIEGGEIDKPPWPGLR